jgi:hypothetical protein
MAVFWDVAMYSLVDIDLMMEAVRTSVSSVSIYQITSSNIPEYSHLHTCCCVDLKCHATVSTPSVQYKDALTPAFC